jgi:hypothetical protein
MAFVTLCAGKWSGGLPMGRILVGWCVGALGGLITGYLLWIFVGEGLWEMKARRMSDAQFAAWEEKRWPQILKVYCAGAASCGLLGAYYLNRPLRLGGRLISRRDRASGSGRQTLDDPLTSEEFQRVFQVCQWISVGDGPEYLRGFIVGWLAEASPAIAKKVDDFSVHHMAALCADLRYNRIPGARRFPKMVILPPSLEELRQLRRASAGFSTEGRSIDYLRGLLVSRLVDSQPALAGRISDLTTRQMQAVHSAFEGLNMNEF